MKHVPQVNWKHWWTASSIPSKSTCVTINKTQYSLSNALAIGYVAGLTKAIKNPMDCK